MGATKTLVLVFATLVLGGCGKDSCGGLPIGATVELRTSFFDPQILRKGMQTWVDVGVEFTYATKGTIHVIEMTDELDKYYGWQLGDTIALNPTMPKESYVSVFAHELGHWLGLHHIDETVWPGCYVMSKYDCGQTRLAEPEYIMVTNIENCAGGGSPKQPGLTSVLYHQE